MKQLKKYFIWFSFFVFISLNIYIFLHSMKLSDQVNHFENQINKLHQENLNLEGKIFAVDSLQYAASMAAQFDFSQKAQPVYLENLKYARNR